MARLDGMPLAIELAAARVDALGVAQLLDRIDDRFGLLADADRLAEERQRSLAAAVGRSYQLLDDAERRVFRAVSVFPGPFSLDGAEAVAGAGAGRAVLRLVDCSLLLPPRAGPDGRSRYVMLETLRAYGARLLAGAEDHDPAVALRLALTLAPWWQLRGRLPSQAPLLAAAAEYADAGSDEWCAARLFLGQVAGQVEDPPPMLEHFTAVRDALEDPRRPAASAGPWLLSICLGGRSSALLQVGRVAEAVEDGRRALDLARETSAGGLPVWVVAPLPRTGPGGRTLWPRAGEPGQFRVDGTRQCPHNLPTSELPPGRQSRPPRPAPGGSEERGAGSG